MSHRQETLSTQVWRFIRSESRRERGVKRWVGGGGGGGGRTLSRWEEEESKKGNEGEAAGSARRLQMKALIKGMVSDKYRGISLLMPATGWSHTERMKESGKTKISHPFIFHSIPCSASSCVFTRLPEGIKVNMLPYPQLPPRTGRGFRCIYLLPSASIRPSVPPSLPIMSPIIPLHRRCNLEFACRAPVIQHTQISPVSPSASLIAAA